MVKGKLNFTGPYKNHAIPLDKIYTDNFFLKAYQSSVCIMTTDQFFNGHWCQNVHKPFDLLNK